MSVDETAQAMFGMGRMNPMNLIQIIREIKSILDMFRSKREAPSVVDDYNFTGQHTDIAFVAENGSMSADVIESIPDENLRNNVIQTYSDAVQEGYLQYDKQSRMFVITEKGREHINSDAFMRQFESDQLSQLSENKAHVQLKGNSDDLEVFRFTDSINLNQLNRSSSEAAERVRSYCLECQKYGLVNISPDGTVTPTEKCLRYLQQNEKGNFDITKLTADNVEAIADNLKNTQTKPGNIHNDTNREEVPLHNVESRRVADIPKSKRKTRMSKRKYQKHLESVQTYHREWGNRVLSDPYRFARLINNGLNLPPDSPGYELAKKLSEQTGIDSTALMSMTQYAFAHEKNDIEDYVDYMEKEEIRRQKEESIIEQLEQSAGNVSPEDVYMLDDYIYDYERYAEGVESQYSEMNDLGVEESRPIAAEGYQQKQRVQSQNPKNNAVDPSVIREQKRAVQNTASDALDKVSTAVSTAATTVSTISGETSGADAAKQAAQTAAQFATKRLREEAQKKAAEAAAKKAAQKAASKAATKAATTAASGAASMGIGAGVSVVVDLSEKGANALTKMDTQSHRINIHR